MSRVDRNYPSYFTGDYQPQPMAPETYYIRLRGLPFSAREEDVRNFLNGIPAKHVTFTLTATGRASGECYVELNDTSAVKDALLLHKKEMGGRYIEVFSVPEYERLQMVRNGVLRGPGECGIERPTKYVVRLRGLPFETNNDDIREFFEGLDIEDIVIDLLAGGRPSGEAFVQFTSKDHAEKALERNKSYMGSRYVEVFRSSWDEMENSYYESRGYPASRSGPIPLREAANVAFEERRDVPGRPRSLFDFDDFYEPREVYSRRGGPLMGPGPISRDRGGFRSSPYGDAPFSTRRSRYLPEEDDYVPSGRRGSGRRIDEKLFMRGMPYSVTGVDIEMFFDPMRCVEIKLGYEPDGRPSGDALVTFGSVMERDRGLARSGKMMGNRYVELFPASDMPVSARRIEFRSVSSTNSFLRATDTVGKDESSMHSRDRGRLPLTAATSRSSRMLGVNRSHFSSHRHSTSLIGGRGSPAKRERLSPVPVPKPVSFAQMNSSRQNTSSYSEGVRNGYSYDGYSSPQHQSSCNASQTSYGSQGSCQGHNYYGAQTQSSTYMSSATTAAQSANYANAGSSYGTTNGYTSSSTSYSQPAYATGSTAGYSQQTTYSTPNTYSAQPYYSQSVPYGQSNSSYAAAYSQPVYSQISYASGEPSKSTW